MSKTTTIQGKILHRIIPAVAIIMILFTITTTWKQNNEQQESMEKHQEELAERVSMEVATKIENLRIELQWSASQKAIQSMDPEQYDEVLAQFFNDNTDDFALMFVAHPDGTYYVANKGFQKATLTDRKYFVEVMRDHKEFAMTSPDVSKSTGEMKYTLAVPIKNTSGAVVGVLAANIKLSTLSDIISSVKSNDKTIHVMCDEKANIIASKDPAQVMKANLTDGTIKNFEGIEDIGTAIKTKKSITKYIKDKTSDNHYYAMNYQLKNTPGWYLVSAVSDEEIKATMMEVIISMIIFTIVVVAIIFFIINITLTRQLTIPLGELSKSIKGLTDGYLNQSFSHESSDEIGQMTKDMRNMCEKLTEIVKTIKVSADTMAMSSYMVKESSKQLSDGTSSQASSIEELSATMEEMSSNIEQNTHNAEITSKVSEEAAQKFNEVVVNINNVLKTNREISEKISIINDVAYQTNILALNAAVEAARAGEYGKGFAVVASEVRKLAENSKRAADAIVEVTRQGLNNSMAANDVMQDTLPRVKNTSTLVNEIATASVEQNTGAMQINEVIQRLNNVVQINAESAARLSQNADELSIQADNLRNATDFFKES
ncbi:MAG: methyl-accepting chemotaxis protein [Bacteroidales bacterium]|nr:methyl-accepting chemotaxis protein [Bacteroidales bacterium]